MYTHTRTHVTPIHAGPVAMCNAATEGDVRYLKLLIRCGVDPDVGDYDNRWYLYCFFIVFLHYTGICTFLDVTYIHTYIHTYCTKSSRG